MELRKDATSSALAEISTYYVDVTYSKKSVMSSNIKLYHWSKNHLVCPDIELNVKYFHSPNKSHKIKNNIAFKHPKIKAL